MQNDPANPQGLIEHIIGLVNSGRTFTDIHIKQDAPIMIKTPHGWRTESDVEVTEEDMYPMLDAIDEDWKISIRAGAIERPFALTNCRLRCSVYLVSGGRKLVISIRRLPLSPLPLDQIGLPLYVKTMLEATKGIILITGTTGSGKTTTNASMLDHINATRSAHIITIEQPIEYELDSRLSLISQKEVPVDTASFSAGLREALRQKPDVIMVGEVRDFDTADTVMHAGESGHLVLATMHTNNAVGAISKLLSFYPPEQRAQRAEALAASLIGVICQSLIPAESADALVLASELLFNNNQQLAPFLADPGKHHMLADFMRRKEDNLSRSLNEDLAQLVQKKRINPKEAMRATYNRVELYEMLNAKR
jgi:twitching motility protein PilT